jgi:hypothetical protein
MPVHQTTNTTFMNTTHQLFVTDDGWGAILVGADPGTEESPRATGNPAEAVDIVRKLDRLERTLSMTFFDFGRFKATVDAAPGCGTTWQVSLAFLSYMQEHSANLVHELESLQALLRTEQGRLTGAQGA